MYESTANEDFTHWISSLKFDELEISLNFLSWRIWQLFPLCFRISWIGFMTMIGIYSIIVFIFTTAYIVIEICATDFPEYFFELLSWFSLNT